MASDRRSGTFRVRQIHRYLGLFIGIQFLLWTVGGLYFSWTDLDQVHGDHLRRAQGHLRADVALASPSIAIAAIRAGESVDSLAGVELAQVLGVPTYRIHYFAGGTRRTRLADAATGRLRAPLGRDEAVRIARADFAGDAPVRSVEYLADGDVGGHHEYREQPLPAWAIHFDHGSGATAYVPASLGAVHRVRNDRWRIFDFLWMLHTMDYAGRDDFNNLAIRAASVLALATTLAGFVLFGLTSRPYRRWLHRRRAGTDPRGA